MKRWHQFPPKISNKIKLWKVQRVRKLSKSLQNLCFRFHRWILQRHRGTYSPVVSQSHCSRVQRPCSQVINQPQDRHSPFSQEHRQGPYLERRHQVQSQRIHLLTIQHHQRHRHSKVHSVPQAQTQSHPYSQELNLTPSIQNRRKTNL